MKTKKQIRWQKKKPRSTGFKIPLENGVFFIVVEYWSRKGSILRFATVLIRLHDEDKGSDEICRYDTAHGFAHLDILDNKGKVINKIAVPGEPTYKSAIVYAIDDLKANYQKYWENYHTRQKRGKN